MKDRSIRRSQPRWENNIKVDLEVGREGMDWIHVTQETGRCRFLKTRHSTTTTTTTTTSSSSSSWHYNPLWVLAFSVILFHAALSLHCFLHRLIPIICISSSISTVHLFFGLPLILVPIGFHSNILLGVLLSSIRITWPSQAILLLF